MALELLVLREGVRREGRVRVQVVEQALKNLKDQFPANVMEVSFPSTFFEFLATATYIVYILL